MAGERRFVVQRHRATRLHYDFRLEIDGVLASWAVPKGPTLDPKVRRAAFHVEDHPMDYVDFEGVIPAGGYGGGDVIVWDAGTWEPYKDPDPAAAVAAGQLHARLHGEKLRGAFVLIRTGRQQNGKDDWLLLHKRDEHAVDGWDPEDHPRSVLSGRTSEEVLADPDRLWDPHTGARALRASEPELRALDRLRDGDDWHVFGRAVRVGDPGTVLFPPSRAGEAPVTRRELLRYVTRTAPTLLPHLAGRTLALRRYPDGAGGRATWQRRPPRHAPPWLTALNADEPAAVVWAAAAGALEWHVDTTGLAVIDLGAGNAWADQVALAGLYRTAFDHLKVSAGVKVGPGIELWVPAAGDATAWVESLARSIAAVAPGFEHHGVAGGPAAVAPYSPLAAPGAPVSAPIGWDELDDPALTPAAFTVRTVADRVAERGDLFAAALAPPRALPPLV
ncbi:DNA polymerase ligase N-terminal domain-containing protein [Dactylosporangium sp. CA-152071]|uniref:non-homologous end-joining DNA ligase LigD n=1 Tax=Dactylosporangium sp. CA-152071 TaxID=3239933 RepID=UPI003D8B31A7